MPWTGVTRPWVTQTCPGPRQLGSPSSAPRVPCPPPQAPGHSSQIRVPSPRPPWPLPSSRSAAPPAAGQSKHAVVPSSLPGGLGPLSVLPPAPSACPKPLQQGRQQLQGHGCPMSFPRSGPGELLLSLQGPTGHLLLRVSPSFAPQKKQGWHLQADLACPQEKASPPPSRSEPGLPAPRVWAEASPQ